VLSFLDFVFLLPQKNPQTPSLLLPPNVLINMAPLFSKRLSCFYCGRRSAQSKKEVVRKWRCKHCEAVNYLDEVRHTASPRFPALRLIKQTSSRKEKSQILLLQRRILLHPRPVPQALASNPPTPRLALACFVLSVSAINIYLPVLWRRISHLQTTQTIAPMSETILNFGRTSRSGTLKFATSVNPG
jgi:hypothetical protein